MAKFTEATSLQDLVPFGQGTIYTVLVNKLVNTLRVEEILDGFTVLLLPFCVGTTPLIIKGNIHRHTPRVVAEIIVSITSRSILLVRPILRGATLWTGSPRKLRCRHQRAVKLTLIRIQPGFLVNHIVQELTASSCTFIPKVNPTVISPACPYFIKSRNMIRRICETLSKAVRSESNEFCFRIYQEHFLRGSGLLRHHSAKTTSWLRSIFFWHNAVENTLSLRLIVDTRIISPTVGSKNQCRNEIEFTIGSSTIRIARSVCFATPGKVSLTDTCLVLHIFFTPPPQTVKNIFLIHLYGNHQ